MSRREFLALLASTAAMGLVSCADETSSIEVPSASLAAYVDVLIPADEFGPSASNLGVDRGFLEQAATDRDFRGLLIAGFRWLDAQTPAGFVALAPDAREQLLVRMSDEPSGSLPRNFLDILRYRCFAAYYANPLSWPGLAINRPPQPLGYMDFES